MATQFCYGTPTGNYGPKGGANFVYFAKAIELGGTALVGQSCLHLLVLRPPVMSLSRVMSLFLRLLVGSFLRTL